MCYFNFKMDEIEKNSIIKNAVIIIVSAIAMIIFTFTCLMIENFDFETLGIIIITQAILFMMFTFSIIIIAQPGPKFARLGIGIAYGAGLIIMGAMLYTYDINQIKYYKFSYYISIILSVLVAIHSLVLILTT